MFRQRVHRLTVYTLFEDTSTPTADVLDIGVGGGEKFLTLAASFGKGIGVDIEPEMVQQAQQNKVSQGVANVEMVVMDTHDLKFPNEQFDVVLNRQCDVNVSETVRVMRTNSYFVTQQVADRNSLNILEAFGWSRESSGEDWGHPMEEIAAEFDQLGCRIVAQAEYDIRYWFRDVDSLVFWLKAAPLPEPFDFDIERHWQSVNRVIEEHGSTRGIETNEHRELLVVRKLS